MKRPAASLSCVLVLFVCTGVAIHDRGLADGAALRVLFVGNSYTYYNSLPRLVEAMAEDAFPGQDVETRFVGAGGATLESHWDEGRALEEIETGRWDYVVLQEQSMLGAAVVEDGELYFSGPDRFFHYARLFDRAIKKEGAETLFFMTWSRRGRAEQQKYLTYAYMTIARETRSKIVPVGLVWDAVRHHPAIDLYDRDGSHPSTSGSFLAAATIVTVLFDSVPARVSGSLEGYAIREGGEPANERSLLTDISDAEVNIIHEATTRVFEQLEIHGGYLDVEEAVRQREPPPQWMSLLKRLGTAEGQAVAVLAGIAILLAVNGCRRWAARS